MRCPPCLFLSSIARRSVEGPDSAYHHDRYADGAAVVHLRRGEGVAAPAPAPSSRDAAVPEGQAGRRPEVSPGHFGHRSCNTRPPIAPSVFCPCTNTLPRKKRNHTQVCPLLLLWVSFWARDITMAFYKWWRERLRKQWACERTGRARKVTDLADRSCLSLPLFLSFN